MIHSLSVSNYSNNTIDWSKLEELNCNNPFFVLSLSGDPEDDSGITYLSSLFVTRNTLYGLSMSYNLPELLGDIVDECWGWNHPKISSLEGSYITGVSEDLCDKRITMKHFRFISGPLIKVRKAARKLAGLIDTTKYRW